MDTKTNTENTPAPQTTENQQQYRDFGFDLSIALLVMLVTCWSTPTWSTPTCETLAETKNKLEKTAQTVAETQRTATDAQRTATDAKKTSTAGLTLGIISTATAAAALITSILTACLT